MKQISILIVTLLIAGCSTTTDKKPAVAPTTKPVIAPEHSTASKLVELPHTETFDLASKFTGKTYVIAIGFPRTYDQQPEKTYPALYITDGQWQFPLWYTMTGFIKNDGDMPDAMLVGIGWKDQNENIMDQRREDLTPTAVDGIAKSGGADKFQAFLRDELFPYIETHYRVTKNRTVTGGSIGALFVYYTLLSQPDLFDGYIASSPTPSWDNGAIFRILETFPNDGIKTPKRAYLCWGKLETEPGLNELSEKLAKRKLKNLTFKGGGINNFGHSGDNAECFNRGLQYIYARPDIQLSDATLKKYTGTYYTAEQDYTIIVALVNHHLTMSYDDKTTMILAVEKQDHFYAPGNVLNFEFNVDSAKNVIGVTTLRNNASTHFDRINK